jgi:pimeloyl-ACP methyl ester carboxylesterase
MMALRRILPLAVALSLAVLIAPSAVRADPFYEVAAADLPGPAGSLIRVQPWPVQGIYRANVYKMLYRSRGLKNEPIAVSASVIVPQFAAPPTGRPVIAWAHPTTGVDPRCAPTLSETPFDSIAGLTQFVADNAVVVATDYPGMGVAGVHPYLIGESAGRAVLDSIRAVRQMTQLQGQLGPWNALWGHSQGGHAVLWAGQLHAQYAPELRLSGIAAAAPATNLAELLDDDASTAAGKILVAMALHSWRQVFGYPIGSIIAPQDEAAIDRAGRDCVDITSSALNALESVMTLSSVYLKANPATTPPWAGTMAKNSPGGMPIRVPVFIAQGGSDEIIAPQITRDFARSLCQNGEQVTLVVKQGVDHGKIAWQSAAQVNSWIMARFEGRPNAGACRF